MEKKKQGEKVDKKAEIDSLVQNVTHSEGKGGYNVWSDTRLKTTMVNLLGFILMVWVSGKMVEYAVDNYVLVG